MVRRLQKMVTTVARGYRYVDDLHNESTSMHLHTVGHDKVSKKIAEDDGPQYFEETRSALMNSLWHQHRFQKALRVDRCHKRLQDCRKRWMMDRNILRNT